MTNFRAALFGSDKIISFLPENGADFNNTSAPVILINAFNIYAFKYEYIDIGCVIILNFNCFSNSDSEFADRI